MNAEIETLSFEDESRAAGRGVQENMEARLFGMDGELSPAGAESARLREMAEIPRWEVKLTT